MRLVELLDFLDEKECRLNEDASSLARFRKYIREKYGIVFDLRQEKTGAIELEKIQVAKDAEPGTGTKAMEELVQWADKNGIMLTLQLAKKGFHYKVDWKKTTSPGRLERFYRRFGFVPNRGRNKRFDLSIYTSMYREPKKKLNESSGDTMVTGWTNPQTGQEYTMHDVSHYEILQKYWKEMGIPEGLVPTLKDAYTGPGQLKAYENGFIRWFMTDYDEPEIGISAPEPLMKQARPLLARLKKAMPPNAVHLDVINPALTYPEPTKSASFRGHDSVAMNRWFQKPFKHNMYESFRDETTIPNIDDIFQDPNYFRTAKKKEAKIVHMTPEEYIKRSWKGFVQIYRDQGIQPPTEKELLTSRNMELVDEYAEAMKRGDEFPMLSLDYSGGYFSQEGLHRALAAIKAGIKKVPVAIVTSVNEDILTESEHSTGWMNVKSNRDISKSGRPSEVPAHYVYLQLFWKEMGIDKDVADTADDAYADTAQLQAYHNGWIRYFFTSQYNVLYASAPELLWKSATPILMKLVKKFQPENVILDVIDPTSASGKATGMGGTFHGTDRANMMRWTQDPFRHNLNT